MLYILVMSYVPPSRRNIGEDSKSSINSFAINISPPKTSPHSSPEPINVDSVESFPTLGIVNTKTQGSDMNFASSLFIPQPKEEVFKNIPDGWVQLSKKNGRTEFTYGDKSDLQYEIEDLVDYMEEVRKEVLLEKILDRYEEYEEIDLFLHGEKHIYGWQVDDYLKDIEMERRIKRMENMTSDDESTDEDDKYEFN